ncbi:MAG: hypothetical protein B6247_22250, partial [Candidatus Parabeggiatoa sp. nov. 2]
FFQKIGFIREIRFFQKIGFLLNKLPVLVHSSLWPTNMNIKEIRNKSYFLEKSDLLKINLPTNQPAMSYGGPLKRSANDPTVLAHVLKQAATTDKGLVYIQSDHSQAFQSYKDLLLDAQKILSRLRKLGLQPQDKVVFQIESSQDFISAFWGCVLGGFVPVPVTHIAYTPEQIHKTVSKLRYTLQMLEQPLLLTYASFASEIPHLPELLEVGNFPVATVDELRDGQPDHNWYHSQPDDVAVMMLTSGSTGIPKGVLLSHRNLLSQTMASVQMNGFSREDINLNWIPIDHVAGLIYFHIRAVYLAQQ